MVFSSHPASHIVALHFCAMCSITQRISPEQTITPRDRPQLLLTDAPFTRQTLETHNVTGVSILPVVLEHAL